MRRIAHRRPCTDIPRWPAGVGWRGPSYGVAWSHDGGTTVEDGVDPMAKWIAMAALLLGLAGCMLAVGDGTRGTIATRQKVHRRHCLQAALDWDRKAAELGRLAQISNGGIIAGAQGSPHAASPP